METNFRILDPQGRVLSECRAETLNEAADFATNMGYTVLDTVSPDVVVATTTEESGEVALSVVVKRNGEVCVTSTITPEQAVETLRSIADSLES